MTWHATAPFEDFLKERDRSTLDGYLHWLSHGMYSALLVDGSLLQVTYEFDGHSIVGHRLAYVPCPVAIPPEWLEELEMADAVELLMTEARDVHMRSVVRFDFDPDAKGPGHPESHFTINGSECRVACASPMRLGRFFDFVFRNFYPKVFAGDLVLQELPKDGWFKRTIVPDDEGALHLTWPA